MDTMVALGILGAGRSSLSVEQRDEPDERRYLLLPNAVDARPGGGAPWLSETQRYLLEV